MKVSVTAKIKNILYYSFLKPRDVYCIELQKLQRSGSQFEEKFKVTKKESADIIHYSFEIIEENTGEIMGSTNLALNFGDILLWHDNFPIFKNEGLIFGSYVNEKFRGRKLYMKMLNFVSEYMGNGDVVRLLAVVESRNYASAVSHERSGYRICNRNYLVKFFKKNVLTIFKKPFRCYFAGKKSNSI